MVIIDQRRAAGFKVREAYFPTADEVWRLAEELPPLATLRARQAAELTRRHPRQIKHNVAATLVIDLTRHPDELLRRMSKTTRQQIGQAIRAPGVRVAVNEPAGCDDFLALHNEFVTTKRYTSPLSRATLTAHLPACDVAVAYVNGDPICGLVVLRDSTVRRALPVYNATSRLRRAGDYARWASLLNRYIHWYMMLHAQAAGLELYDFGGIWGEDDPISRFKLSFGGERLHEHNYAFAGPLVHLALKIHRLPAVQALRMRFA